MQTDEARWLKRFEVEEAREAARVELATAEGPLLIRRLELDGKPMFSLEFGGVTVKLAPAQTLRLVQMLVGLADLEGAR